MTPPSARCPKCLLNQFLTERFRCRRCQTPLSSGPSSDPPDESPKPANPPNPVDDPTRITWKAKQFHRQMASTIGYRMLHFRRFQGWSQQEVADALDVPRSYISKAERGHVQPSVPTLCRMSKAMRVPVRSLIESLAEEDIRIALEDPFTAAMAPFVPHLTSSQRAFILSEVMRMANLYNCAV